MAATKYIFPQHLPDASKSSMDFHDSAFFKANGPNTQFPGLEEVRRLSGVNNSYPKPAPVVFKELNLIVKYGPYVKITEAQCLWIIRRVLGSTVPVPEVYGWRVDGQDVFIYMQLIYGHRLKDRWGSMTILDKTTICEELHRIVTALRQVEQNPSDPFIGSIDRQGPLDYVFEGMPGGRPFHTVKDFNDWISWLPQHDLPDSQKYDDPYRLYLPDNDSIVLTHGDLHRSNIIVSATTPPHIAAIVDWGQASWCPAFWEYCKALYTASYLDEWRIQWIPRFLTPRDTESRVLSQYFTSWGGV